MRVREAREVGKEEVHKGRRDIEELRTLLLSGKDAHGRPLSAAQKQRYEALLKTLEERETQTLPQATSSEMTRTEALLAKARELEKNLPKIIEEAQKRANRKPSDLLLEQYPHLYDVYQSVLGQNKSVGAYRKELEAQLTQLKGIHKRIGKFQHKLNPRSPHMYRPEVAFVSKLTGQVYPLVMMLGEAPRQINEMQVASRLDLGVTYSLVDVTSSQTQDVSYGHSNGDKHDPRTHHEAITAAFKNFGKRANYGEGILVVRIPPGPVNHDAAFHPGTKVTYYQSEEGSLQKALRWIGYIAAVAGAAALIATGVGAPAAAALLGTIAAVGGVIVSVSNIAERARREKLALDAELALDVIGIIGVAPAFMGARHAMRMRYLSRGLKLPPIERPPRPSWYLREQRVGKFLKIYGTFEIGATVILVPVKLAQDIDRIESDPTLTRAQKDALIKQAELGALQSFLMLAGSAVATATAGRKAAALSTAEVEAQQQQIKLLELEGYGEYRSMADRGYFTADGELTKKALDEIETVAPGARGKLLAAMTPTAVPESAPPPRAG